MMLNIVIMVILANIICIFAIVSTTVGVMHYHIDNCTNNRIVIELIDRFSINGSIRDNYTYWGHRSSPNI